MIETFHRPTRIQLRHQPVGSTAVVPKQASRSVVEFALWLACLALVARLTVFNRQRFLEDFAVVDMYAVCQILIVLGSLLLVVVSGRLGKVWRSNARRASGWLALFYIFGAVSALWSPAPVFSFYRALEVLSQIAAVHVALSYAPGFAAAERRVVIVGLASMGLGIVAVIDVFGFKADFAAWHTNQFTVPAMLCFTYAFGEILSGRRKQIGFLTAAGGLGLLGVILGTSSASIIAMFFGMIVALVLARSHGTKLILFSALLGGIVLIFGATTLARMVFYGKTQQSVEQLSGRKYIWQGYLKDFRQQPALGQGFAISARISSHYRTTNTHNSALSVLLGTGLAGMTLVLLAFRRFIRDALQSVRQAREGSVGCAAAIAAGLVNSMSVAFLGETWMMSSLSFICILGLFSSFVGTSPQSREPRRRLVLRPRTSI